MSARRIAVAGAGMAAARFGQQLLARTAPGAVEVTLYGDEPHAPYNRTLLTDALTGRYDTAGLTLPYGPGAGLRTGTEVTAVDAAARVLRLADGSTARYDTLVLATGAAPVLPRLRGVHGPGGGLAARDGVHVLRTLADCRRLAGDARRAGRAVVIGGGVLGVGTARALAALGPAVELVHRSAWLMNRQLDAASAGVLRSRLAGLGVTCHLGVPPRTLAPGTGQDLAVELADGRRLETDLVVLACGTRPRTALARAAGLRVRRGIVVDDRLAASAPGIHAIGDCAEHRGLVHGRAGAAWEQADALAARLSGADPGARYTGTRAPTRLTAGALHLAAFGDPDADRTADPARGPAHDVLHIADTTRGTCRRLVARGDRLVGAVLLGDLATVGDLGRAWQHDEPLPADLLSLIVPEGARP
ncbi:FAD-dependent oxidoreductase [Streptomyces sp. NPDC049577]|uniref:NAD(P)/FAD-dependent oxidoreductase n=1 Tax=Streptomyces sp. NPDC049577 TaxID=3155153 RepID=UPI00342458BC